MEKNQRNKLNCQLATIEKYCESMKRAEEEGEIEDIDMELMQEIRVKLRAIQQRLLSS